MPAKNKRGNLVNKPSFSVQGKPAGTGETSNIWDFKDISVPSPQSSSFRPLPTPRRLSQRTYSTLSTTSYNDAKMGPCEMVFLDTTVEGKIQATRHQKEKERNPDRICLDKRGITSFPSFVGEGKIKLLSLQHNLISKIDDIVGLTRLVFLDLYNNQVEAIQGLDSLLHLRVLLLGKNRVQRLEGLDHIKTLEVLDLHGNQICDITGLSSLHMLKVLNLASNQIRSIEKSQLYGLHSLEELNLRRNRIKKLNGFEDVPQLQKLYVSNNDIQSIEDICDLANAIHLKEITIDGNPVALIGDCVLFLVAYVRNLKHLNQMLISEDIKKSAKEWRGKNSIVGEEVSNLELSDDANAKKQEVISKARSHWKLLRSQARILVEKESKVLNSVDILDSPLLNEGINDVQKKLPERPSSVPNSLLHSSSGTKKTVDEILVEPNKLNAQDKNMRGILQSQFRHSASRSIVNVVQRKRQNFLQKTFPQSSENVISSISSSQTPLGPLRLPPILAPFLVASENQNNGSTDKSAINPDIASKISTQFSKGSNDSSSSLFFYPVMGSEMQNVSEIVEPNAESSLSSPVSDSSDDSSSDDGNNGGIASASCLEEDDSDFPTVNSSNVSEDGKLPPKISASLNQKMKKTSYRSQLRIITCKNKQKASVLPSRTKEQVASEIQNNASIDKPAINHIASKISTQFSKGSDYLIEIEDYCLNIYGQGALRHIDKPWNPSKAAEVNSIKFHYISFNNVALLFGRIKQLFPNVEHFNFRETNIHCLGQINALAELQGLTSLQIDGEGNPIATKNWRSYAVFRLYHWGLRVINQKEISEEEVNESSSQFHGLSDIVLWSLPDALLLPLLGKLHVQGSRSGKAVSWSLSPKEWLWEVADPALRDVVAKEALQWRRSSISQEDSLWRKKGYVHLGQILDVACQSVEKLKLLDKEWPSILNELIRNTLVDYSQLESYMKKRMLELKLC